MKTVWAILCFMVYVNTDLGGHSVLALTNVPAQDDAESISNFDGGAAMPAEALQGLLWLFRTDDMPAWNYSILSLSVMVLLIGIVLLGTSIKANKNRKVTCLHKDEYEDKQPDETETKQGFMALKESNNSDNPAENLLPNAQNAGQVMIQWKDGNVTPLYAAASEEDV
ncbi:organic solute transporter subunit beta [Elgaria multicarinata webbii]|uniref:organic solute transporter subunit beta n=1 Tax=Elgaria multicarinata webbii TaxID=159646 RepID=UPI002FCD4E96